MQINVQFYRKEAPYVFSGESDTSHVILSAITQESPKNHPRITQVCQGMISVEFRRTFEQIAGETGEDCGGYSGGKGRNGEEVGRRFFYVFFVEKFASIGKK